jgi:hypothetical protein
MIPRTENINNVMMRMPPTLINDGMVIINVWKMILRLLAFLISLRTRMMRNARNMEVAVPTEVKTEVYFNILIR